MCKRILTNSFFISAYTSSLTTPIFHKSVEKLIICATEKLLVILGLACLLDDDVVRFKADCLTGEIGYGWDALRGDLSKRS